MIHWLKTKTDYFDLIWIGEKQFEIRLNDRNYQVGDILILAKGILDARADEAIIARVESVLDSHFEGLAPGYVAMSLHILGHMSDESVELYDYHKTKVQSEQWSG